MKKYQNLLRKQSQLEHSMNDKMNRAMMNVGMNGVGNGLLSEYSKLTNVQDRSGFPSNDGYGTYVGSYINTCNGKIFGYMIDNEQLLMIWQNAVDIIPDGDDDGVFLGVFENITDAPAGVNAVMLFWTQTIQLAMQELDVSETQKLELLSIRGFTFDEYKILFDISVKEHDYTRYPVYQSLLITTAKERAGVIYQLSKDSYEDYLKLLARTLRLFNPLLYNFLYE